LRAITAKADEGLATLERRVDQMDSQTGRPSIPPERLLKSEVLIALFSIRGHRLFCEARHDTILFRCLPDMSLAEPGFDHSTFGQNCDRLLRHEGAQHFVDAVVTAARREGLLSDEHVTVDGTLLEAWASLTRVTPKAAPAVAPPPNDPGNPTVDVHGERRTNPRLTARRTRKPAWPAKALARRPSSVSPAMC
jgi:transposase